MPEDRLFTLSEVSEVLKVSRKTVQNLIASGELAAVRIGPRVVRVTGQALAEAMKPYTPPRDAA